MLSVEEKLKKRVETGELELPVLPAVAAEVMALTRSDDADAQQLAELIQNDQSLSGHVMRMANSAAYNTYGQIQTLQQAIAKLGLRQVGQMALTVSVKQSVFKTSAATQQLVDYLWRHALASAIWARELARICRSNTEVAFLCGLLHQIGKPVAVNVLEELVTATEKSESQIFAMIDKYNKVIGVNLARRWQLPEAVVEAINYLDDYYGAPSARQEVMVVKAARLLADNTLDETEAALPIADLANEHEIFEALNLYEEDLAVLEEKTDLVNEALHSLCL